MQEALDMVAPVTFPNGILGEPASEEQRRTAVEETVMVRMHGTGNGAQAKPDCGSPGKYASGGEYPVDGVEML